MKNEDIKDNNNQDIIQSLTDQIDEFLAKNLLEEAESNLLALLQYGLDHSLSSEQLINIFQKVELVSGCFVNQNQLKNARYLNVRCCELLAKVDTMNEEDRDEWSENFLGKKVNLSSRLLDKEETLDYIPLVINKFNDERAQSYLKTVSEAIEAYNFKCQRKKPTTEVEADLNKLEANFILEVCQDMIDQNMKGTRSRGLKVHTDEIQKIYKSFIKPFLKHDYYAAARKLCVIMQKNTTDVVSDAQITILTYLHEVGENQLKKIPPENNNNADHDSHYNWKDYHQEIEIQHYQQPKFKNYFQKKSVYFWRKFLKTMRSY